MKSIWFVATLRFYRYCLYQNLVLVAAASSVLLAPNWIKPVLADPALGEEQLTSMDNGAESSSTDSSKAANEHTKTPPVEPTEYISAWIADLKQSNARWILVDLSEQQLSAWEGSTPMYSALVSTGKEGDWTPPGVYSIETKYSVTSMQGEDYNIPDVPFVMYFFGSYAIHGAYWRNSFGTPASRGCVSLEPTQAEWLFSWASEGTRVVIQQ